MTLITAESTIIPIVFFAVNFKNILNIKTNLPPLISNKCQTKLLYMLHTYQE